VIAVSPGSSFGHSLLARLGHGIHDRTVWIALALTAVILLVTAVTVWLGRSTRFDVAARGGDRTDGLPASLPLGGSAVRVAFAEP